MSLIEAEHALSEALSGSVKRKNNNTRNLRSRASRVTRNAPEVMVKISSFGKGAVSVQRHLQYISRNGKVDLETDRGEILQGREQVADYFKGWKEEINDGGVYKNRRDTMHMILSMPADTPSEAVRLAGREFAKRTFAGNHEYVMALHTDEPHPHVHITVKMLGFDGKRLHISRDRPQEFRETFADALRDQGVEAEATPRQARGVVRRPYNAVAKHIVTETDKRPARQSKVQVAKIQSARDELLAENRGDVPPADPWEQKVRRAHARVRRAWAKATELLSMSGDSADKGLAEKISAFMASRLPSDVKPPLTERAALKAKLMQGASEIQVQQETLNPQPRPPRPEVDADR